ncbi:cation:proton antiporter family protein [Bacillus sp. FJAT-45350]|uniref:cation:proton antiporter family protein n=1 Tax=Bacillus sp. FJAT-45350 TaxID=2011014 RepID=UPI000BB7A2ED|nr:cation:proton antiporter family protein [Bacillus sp. FJAT-45350]
MEEHASVTSLVIVVVIAFLIPVILHKLKLRVIPVVVAEIIAGIIIGRSGFNLVTYDIWLETLSLLGFIFLMFLSGLEIDFSAFAKKSRKKTLPNGKLEPNAFTTAFTIFVFIFAISFALSLLFVWTGFIENAFLMTLIISTISLGVVVPTLKEENLMKTAIGQIILLVAVIADLVTMVLLAVFVSIYADNAGNMWLLLLLFAAGILLYFIGKKFRHQSYIETMSKGTIQIDTRAIFTLIILLVALSESVGAENILGAFLAGVLVSLLSPNPEMVRKLDSFGYGFLIPIFFVMVGVELDLWSLFGDKKVLILIPLLFLGLLISKVVPSLLLLRWYDKGTALGAGFLLTSTLSLVIAAAAIGERIGVIDSQLSSALILVAVISCIVTPIVFKKIFPREREKTVKEKVTMVGANQFTLPLSLTLDGDRFETRMFHTKQQKVGEKEAKSLFSIEELEDFKVEELQMKNVFNTDIAIIATGEETRNHDIAKFAKETEGVNRVIARVESPSLEKSLKESGIDVFSVFFSNQAVLRAMVESPSVIDLISTVDNGLYEVDMNNSKYDGVVIRKFPYLGDTVFVRIFRGNESIIPHGDTELNLGDRIVVSGSAEHIKELRKWFLS